jgi:ribosomal-protein-alanine N-acetyltransferase
MGTVEIETERLILRRTYLSDAQMMFNNWANDPEVTRFLLWETHTDIDMTKTILSLWDTKYGKPDFYLWGLVIKGNGQLMGTIGAMNTVEMFQCTELGYCIGRSYWGKGYMTEAVANVIEYLFNTVGFNRITARFNPDNIASGRVMQKNNMVFEGISRKAGFTEKQGFYDFINYAILKEDYKNN